MSEAQPQKPAPAAPAPKKKQREHDALLKALMKAMDDSDPPMALLTPGGAQMLVAWMLLRKDPIPKDPREVIESAKQLKKVYPLLWKPLQGMNFIGFARALELSGLPKVTYTDLQNKCGELA